MKDKIRGSLIGGAIGDALGYQIEFKRNIKEKEVTRFNGVGIISDDTQMSLFTAVGLIYRETRLHLKGIALVPTDAVYLAYKDWLETQNNVDTKNYVSWIKSIPELNVPRAPGNTCLSSLMSDIQGTIENPINNSKGCGTVMRVAPIGLYAKTAENAGITGAEVAALTHGHPLAIIPSYILSSMINLIVYNNMTIKESIDESFRMILEENRFSKKDINEFKELVDKAVKLSHENINDIDAIYELGEGWVADEALAIAIYSCLKYQNSFEDAIVCSVNHDGDSDSTGAITGNIMGAYLGINNIPNYYVDNVELKDVILEIADDLATKICDETMTKEWLDKYLYLKNSKQKTI